MPKHPTSPRVPKPQPEPDDKFILFVEQVAIWARENTRLIIVAAILAVVVVAGGIYYMESQRRVEAEAATRLTEIQQTVMTGNVPLAIRDLQTYLSSFAGTRAGREARLILADLLIAQERPAEAIEALGNLHRDLDEPVGLAAAQLLGAAYEDLEQYDDAIDTYRRVARNARFEFQRREALSAAARVALETGQPNLAADLYDRLVGTFEESDPTRGYYEMWRAEARIRAAAGPQVQPASTSTVPTTTETPGVPGTTDDPDAEPTVD